MPEKGTQKPTPSQPNIFHSLSSLDSCGVFRVLFIYTHLISQTEQCVCVCQSRTSIISMRIEHGAIYNGKKNASIQLQAPKMFNRMQESVYQKPREQHTTQERRRSSSRKFLSMLESWKSNKMKAKTLQKTRWH